MEVDDLAPAQLVVMSNDIAAVLKGKNVGDVLTVLSDHVAAAIASGSETPEDFAGAVQAFTQSVIFRGFDFIEHRESRRKAH